MLTPLIQKYGIIWLLFIAMACNPHKGKSFNQESTMKDTLVFTGCQEDMKLEVGSLVEIKMEATKGTGYQWLLKEPCPLLQLIETDVIRYSSTEDSIPGQKSFQVLQFKAMKKGEGMIRLEYRRAFEMGIEKACNMKIVVE